MMVKCTRTPNCEKDNIFLFFWLDFVLSVILFGMSHCTKAWVYRKLVQPVRLLHTLNKDPIEKWKNGPIACSKNRPLGLVCDFNSWMSLALFTQRLPKNGTFQNSFDLSSSLAIQLHRSATCQNDFLNCCTFWCRISHETFQICTRRSHCKAHSFNNFFLVWLWPLTTPKLAMHSPPQHSGHSAQGAQKSPQLTRNSISFPTQ